MTTVLRTKALVLKRMRLGGGGVRNYQKLRNIIYGRPQWESDVRSKILSLFGIFSFLFSNLKNCGRKNVVSRSVMQICTS